MRTVRLIWKRRVTKLNKAAILKMIQQHYRNAKDVGDAVELRAPNKCTKFLWIFMLSNTFKDLE